ncbi:MAG TPA: cytochrome c [Reyranella sp.]|nr:cytochrome c [Reyranella sp.]
MKLLWAALSAVALLYAATAPLTAAAQTLIVSDRESKKSLTRQDLLSRPALRTITIADPVYHRSMTYRAVPAADVLQGMKIADDDDVQARAMDNFSVGIPARLLTATGAAVPEAFVAVEDTAAPWPPLPNHPEKAGAGPFFLIWRLAPSIQISSEYWVYRLAALAVTDGSLKRWPSLAVGPEVPAGDPVRTGVERYVELCIACHRFKGAGEGDKGPDLGRPMNPVEYYQIPALKKFIRDPASVRQWPDQKMTGFNASTLSDADLDAIIAWLAYKARQR